MIEFPITRQQEELLYLQKKREELTKKRDRLNVRIGALSKLIDTFCERKRKEKEFWERHNANP